jgi:hypothetical protein
MPNKSRIPDWKRDRKRQCLPCLVCGEGVFLPKNGFKLQDNHNVSSEYLREMQIQRINSRNQAFGFQIEFVRGALRVGPDLTIVAIAARLSRIFRGAVKWVTHFSDKFGPSPLRRNRLDARTRVFRSSSALRRTRHQFRRCGSEQLEGYQSVKTRTHQD